MYVWAEDALLTTEMLVVSVEQQDIRATAEAEKMHLMEVMLKNIELCDYLHNQVSSILH